MNIDKDTIKNVIIDQSQTFKTRWNTDNLVPRLGVSDCQKLMKAPHVLLVTGLRRVGKSIFSHLITSNKDCPAINFDDERLLALTAKDLNTILECFYELYGSFDTILLDEIQNVEGWELFVNRIREQFRIIVTGSNAHLLSSELATHLTGRFSAHTLFPLTFSEYLSFRNVTRSKNDLHSTQMKSAFARHFNDYLKGGGVLDHYTFGSDFMRTLFSSIMSRDIVMRHRIKYPLALEKLGLLLINSLASKASPAKLSRHLEIKSPHTIAQYMHYLENAFLIFSVSRFSYKPKEQQSSFKKIYATDNGLATSINLDFESFTAKYLENLVAIELKRRCLMNHTDLFYWNNYYHECDFVVSQSRHIKEAYQVCYVVTHENENREFSGLLAALKEYKLKQGIILTHSQDEEIKKKGFTIQLVPVWKWLLS